VFPGRKVFAVELLLLSNSTNHGDRPYGHVRADLAQFVTGLQAGVFVPYALADHDAYTAAATPSACCAPCSAPVWSL
jgi:hypothetical protein